MLSIKNRYINQQKITIFQLLIISIIFFSFILSCNNLFAAEIKITIDPNLNAEGHNLYYGQTTKFSNKIDLVKENFYVASNLQEGTTYYFAVTAYDKYGNESVFSDVLPYTVPGNNSGGGSLTGLSETPSTNINLTSEGTDQAATLTETANSNQAETMYTPNDESATHIIEMGEILVDHNWQRVEFEGIFIDPIVVAKTVSLNDPDQAVVRIRNVDKIGFDIRIQEWDYLDGVHEFENVSYIVVEKGSYILPGGIKMEAGTFETDGQSFNPFADSFNQIPVVIASVTSVNRQNAVDGRINNVSINGFEYRLQEQESNSQFQNGIETISFIAIESFSGILNGLTIEVGTTGTKVDHNFNDIVYAEDFLTVPYFLADMQTVNEMDTSNVRYRNKDRYGVEVHISEEQSKDAELRPSNENLGYIIIAEQ